jgi:alpha-methylacyl-CoA racemase
LQGYKIVSLALNVPGCIAAARLQELGARITKIEPPGGDPLIEMSREWYELLIQDMRVSRLDLKDPAQYRKLAGWLRDADLLFSSMRPSALQRLGLSWQDLQAQYPGICHVALTGYPEPYENRPGHDLTYQAEAGLLSPPDLPRSLLADLAGVERVVISALALLLARERGHGAGFQQVSIFQAGQALADPMRFGLTAPGGILGGGLPGYKLYPARSGWIAIATLEGHFQKKLIQVLGLENDDALDTIFREKTAGEWAAWAEEHDLPLVEVNNILKSPIKEEDP